MQISLFDTYFFILINKVIVLNANCIDSNKICCDNNNVKEFVDVLLKSILKRIAPLVVGGTITGIILIYFLGFFISIVLNSIIWLIISTFLYKYHWKMNGLEDILILYIFIFSKIKKEKNKEQHY